MAITDRDPSATVGVDAKAPLFSPEQLLWIDRIILNRRTDPPPSRFLCHQQPQTKVTRTHQLHRLRTPVSFSLSLLVQVHCNVCVGGCAQHIHPVNNPRRDWHIPGLHTCGTRCFPKAAMYLLVGSPHSRCLVGATPPGSGRVDPERV